MKYSTLQRKNMGVVFTPKQERKKNSAFNIYIRINFLYHSILKRSLHVEECIEHTYWFKNSKMSSRYPSEDIEDASPIAAPCCSFPSASLSFLVRSNLLKGLCLSQGCNMHQVLDVWRNALEE